jgi:hypothetical protein
LWNEVSERVRNLFLNLNEGDKIASVAKVAREEMEAEATAPSETPSELPPSEAPPSAQ